MQHGSEESAGGARQDREAMLVLWLLRQYRWGGGQDASGAGAGGRVVLFVNAISTVLRLTSVLALLLESPSAAKVLSRVKMSSGPGEGKDSPALKVDVIGLHSRMRQKDRQQTGELSAAAAAEWRRDWRICGIYWSGLHRALDDVSSNAECPTVQQFLWMP
ncbi:unnamed protein product [Prorocentrum cordatum]|uniref:Uncharacterized protein n=1 Tax=Prorocentrum cordatum TaxID=2364126 RepID=A0ABN9PWM6_9DINO|nr:unnamed protein product [Polarella glacialis]